MNRIVENLPQSYREDKEQAQIADALTREVSSYLELWLEMAENFEERFLDFETCDPAWLDTLAAWAGWGKYWDSTWAEEIKRSLLRNTDFIWRNRGNIEGMQKLLEIFGVDATIVPLSGFFLGVSTVPGFLANDPFGYEIVLPATSPPGSPEYLLVQSLELYYLPCWTRVEIRILK